MARTTIQELRDFGQSIWLDNISRSLIDSGKLKSLIDKGVTGLTSNPSIFDKAISSSADYDKKIEEVAAKGKTTFEIYDELTVRDVRDAAEAFKTIYEETNGRDGYVSLEVNPKIAAQVRETVDECKRLHKKVDRPNVMFKIPATDAGFFAAEELIGGGININITLIFSLGQYGKSAEAYLKGLEKFHKNKGDIKNISSVASVFISRIDSVIDPMLDQKGLKELRGKAAAANTGIIFAKYIEIFSGDRFKRLQRYGAVAQRALWGSTSTKDPSYSDIKYVYELIGKNTVNTVPGNTIEAFLDHGKVDETLTPDCVRAREVIEKLKAAGIDINSVCGELLDAGLKAFEKSFESLLKAIENKSKSLCKK